MARISSRHSVASSYAKSSDGSESSSNSRGFVAVRKTEGRHETSTMAAYLKNVEKNGASNCPRGKPLWMRDCKACLDVASSCKLESINTKGGPQPRGCPALRNKLLEWLEKEHLRDPPVGMDVKRKIEELALERHVRAQQVVEESGGRGCLKADGNKCMNVVRDWGQVIAEQSYIEKTPCEMGNEWINWESKRKEDEALAFVKTLGLDKDAKKEEAESKARAQVASLIAKQEAFVKFKQDFLPNFFSARQKEAAKITSEFHASSLLVEEFFKTVYGRPATLAERNGPFKVLARYYDRHDKELLAGLAPSNGPGRG